MDSGNAVTCLSIANLLIALGSFGMSFYVKHRANKLSEGAIETTLRASITNTEGMILGVTKDMRPLLARLKLNTITPEEREILAGYESDLGTAKEAYLNSFEDACSKYLDGKIDKKRFRKTYHVELRNLVERSTMKAYFDPTTTRFKAILKIYHEWENLEK